MKRPRNLSECPKERPCPWVGCKWHMYLDVSPVTGRITYNKTEYKWCCFFDLMRTKLIHKEAEIGEMFGYSHQRINQIVNSSIEKLSQKKTIKGIAVENDLQKKEKPPKTSVYRGVSWHKKKKKWQASGYNNKLRFLGYYDNEIDAYEAYLKFKEEGKI